MDESTRPVGVPLDTSPEAFELWIAALRSLGDERRLARTFELSEAVRRRIEEGIRDRHAGYDQRQVFLARARLMLGDELYRDAYPGEAMLAP